ncbi:ricin-type beta-trefoil lectin domain protein, partial [Streptomyces sp. NPDC057474]|uniref:ricin-type beta-trefoil lectin domain protein n=1 Tax=Streptomyces sp. NPDC057474 TaxID=3346144 RepID=UPI003694C1D6
VPGWQARVNRIIAYDVDAKVDLTATGIVLVIPESEVRAEVADWVVTAITVASGFAITYGAYVACVPAISAAPWVCGGVAGSLGSMGTVMIEAALKGEDLSSGSFWAKVAVAGILGAIGGAVVKKYVEPWAENDAKAFFIGIGNSLKTMAQRASWWAGNIVGPVGRFAAVLADLGTSLASALAEAIRNATGITSRVRIKFDDSRNVCLTAHERKVDPLVLERCDGDNMKGNWQQMRYSETHFMLKNFASGECLDAADQPRLGLYTSKCDATDGGQVWNGDCEENWLMSAGPTTLMTGWNDNTVSMQAQHHPEKQDWIIAPSSLGC